MSIKTSVKLLKVLNKLSIELWVLVHLNMTNLSLGLILQSYTKEKSFAQKYSLIGTLFVVVTFFNKTF